MAAHCGSSSHRAAIEYEYEYRFAEYEYEEVDLRRLGYERGDERVAPPGPGASAGGAWLATDILTRWATNRQSELAR
jgi:hypothetical protein